MHIALPKFFLKKKLHTTLSKWVNAERDKVEEEAAENVWYYGRRRKQTRKEKSWDLFCLHLHER